MSDQKRDKDDTGAKDEWQVWMSSSGYPQPGSAEARRMELQLLAKLEKEGPTIKNLEYLVCFYGHFKQEKQVRKYLDLWSKQAQSQEEMANSMFRFGQHSERIEQFEDAAVYYRKGLTFQTENKDVLYYLHNNLAFCLNLQGEYKEAMEHTRQAITINPSRSNAFKNLGISLQGLGRYGKAALAWLTATHVNAGDERSLKLLEKLMVSHREEVLAEIPDIDKQLEDCRQAVQYVQNIDFSARPEGTSLN